MQFKIYWADGNTMIIGDDTTNSIHTALESAGYKIESLEDLVCYQEFKTKDKFSITKNGLPLDPLLYDWNEEFKTLITKESNLVLNFSNMDGVVFNTGSDCSFKTGSDCLFYTGTYCIFKTGSHCKFVTGENCAFGVGHSCKFNVDSNQLETHTWGELSCVN